MRRSAGEDHAVSDAAGTPPAPAETEAAAAPTAVEDAPGTAAVERAQGSAAVDDVPAPVASVAPPEHDETTAEPAEPAPEQAPAEPEQSTAILTVPTEPAPAHDAAAVPRKPGFRERGRMRRRLRYLREVRELGFRDLGGLVFDQHRFQRPNETLVQGKAAAIDAIDREARALSAALGEHKDYSELFVAGVSACQRCGTLHGSEARFCPHCGLAFSGPRFLAGVGAGDDPHLGETATTPGQAALFDPQAARTADSEPAAQAADTAADPQAHDATP